jgi:uncharacterized protein YkwD
MLTYCASLLRTLLGTGGPRSAAAALLLLAVTLVVAVPSASAGQLRHPANQAHAAPSAGQLRHPWNQAHTAKGCANADTPAVGASSNAMRMAVTCLINQQRVSRHLPTLHDESRLDRSAQGWTNGMIRSGAFWHGSDFATRITAAGYDWSHAGENIATGFSTPRTVVNAWMASTGHCQNILDPSFSDVGTGVGRKPVGRSSSGGSAWTQDFGLPIGQPAPSNNFGPSHGCPY